MKDIILLGGGGHCKSVIDSINSGSEFNVVGILDLKEKVGTSINGVEVIGEDSDLDDYYKQGIKYAFITLGGVGDSSQRLKLNQIIKNIGYRLPPIVDKTAIISEKAKIGEGTFVGKGSIINTNVEIGENCIINTGTIIDHDSCVNDFCHIAPGTTLSGGVHVGNCTHIGTNSTVIQNIKIGANTIVGAGSVVVKNIDSNTKAYGNPCRVV